MTAEEKDAFLKAVSPQPPMNNPQTTWSGIAAAISATLYMLAALPFESGSPLAGIIPQSWKPYIIIVGIIATLALRVWNAVFQKDKS